MKLIGQTLIGLVLLAFSCTKPVPPDTQDPINNDTVIVTDPLDGLPSAILMHNGLQLDEKCMGPDIHRQFWLGADTVFLDLDDDGAGDIQFVSRFRIFLSGAWMEHFGFRILNPDFSFVGTSKADTIARWINYDTLNQRFCSYEKLYQASDSLVYDSLAWLKVQKYVALPKLEDGSIIASDSPFVFNPNLEYTLSNYYDASEDYAITCYDHHYRLGVWQLYDNGLIGFRFMSPEKTAIGYFHVFIGYGRLAIDKICWADI